MVATDLAPGRLVCVAAWAAEVDDLCRLVEQAGYEVRCFGGGGPLLRAIPADACCVVCDDRLPDVEGTELQARLRAARPDLPVIVASLSGSLDAAVAAMRNGAVTVLARPLSADRLRAAIAEAAGVQAERKAREARRREIADRFAALTPEESATLDLLLQGVAYKVIAIKTRVALRTVERRRTAIFKTLGVDSIVAAALLRAELHGGLYAPSAN